MRFTTFRTLTVLLAAALLLAGCAPKSEEYPDRLSPVGESVLCLPAGTNLVLKLMVEGPLHPGLLGGKGQRSPVSGALVTFSLAEDDSEIAFPAGSQATSDSGGLVTVPVAVGRVLGDRTIRAVASSRFGEVKCAFRLACGLTTENTRQEILADSEGARLLTIRVTDPQGAPVAGAPVHFSIDPFLGCRLSARDIATDENGVCGTRILAGSATGETEVSAEVEIPGQGSFRCLRFRSVVINASGIIIGLLGGLALFLLGMTMMSESLQSVAGSRLKSILQLFVRNRFTGIAVGTVITAIVQSSSATSVMVVGFVNAGLMSLEQAISVIFGSCIGTTLTTQIIAFGLSSVALPAVLLGFIIRMASKKATNKHWGEVIMGFGLLFFGMDMMSKTLVPLRTSPTFVNLFRAFDCTPVDGFMPLTPVLVATGIGLVATMIVQSSAATIGVVMALAGTGLINFYTAFPLVLGDNIGTTITANLAAMGANRKARRAALVNTIIKAGGTLVMLPLLYVKVQGEPVFLLFIEYITSGTVLGGKSENIIRHIAMAHTMFNVVTVIILTPFTRQLAWLCERLIPVSDEENGRQDESLLLNDLLLKTPALAITQIISELVLMLKRTAKMVNDSYLCLCEGSTRFLGNVARREESINAMNRRITAYTAALAGHNLNDDEGALLPELLHISHDIERIGDLAINISELAQKRHDEQITFSPSAVRELSEIAGLLQKQFSHVVTALTTASAEDARQAMGCEQDLNAMHHQMAGNHMKRLDQGKCSPQACVLFLDVIGNVERIGDHLHNISQRVDYIIPYIIKEEVAIPEDRQQEEV